MMWPPDFLTSQTGHLEAVTSGTENVQMCICTKTTTTNVKVNNQANIRTSRKQFKLLHRKLPTNSFLQKIGLQDNGNCSFCGDEPDTLTHLCWTCNKTQLFWMEVVVWLKECDVVRESYSLKMTTALGLKPDTSNFKLQINYCLLLARFFVWCCKVKEKGMRWCNFKQILKWNFEIETTAPQNKLELKKWNPLSLTF